MEICCANCKDYDAKEDSCGTMNSDACLWEKGKYQTVRGKYNNYYNHFVPKEDKMAWDSTTARMINKPDKVEYKPTGKKLTARGVVYFSRINSEEMSLFGKWLTNFNISTNDNLFNYKGVFLPYALKHGCFMDFLFDNGYIEKVEEEWISPQIGDKFRLEGEIYTLSRIGERLMVLIGDNNANRWASYIEVKDVFNITKKEFQKLCGTIPVDELERI